MNEVVAQVNMFNALFLYRIGCEKYRALIIPEERDGREFNCYAQVLSVVEVGSLLVKDIT